MRSKIKFLSITLAVFLVAFSCAFLFTNVTANANANVVYLGGTPIGITVSADGMVVAEFVDVITKEGTKKPAESAGIQIGDMIISIDNKSIFSPDDIAKAIKDREDSLEINLKRNAENVKVWVTPVRDVVSGECKLGLYVRNSIAGVGTLTYVNASNNRFGALGHQISDCGTENAQFFSKGHTYPCNVLGVVKAQPNEAGALKGTFKKDGITTGIIDKNCIFGVFGVANEHLIANRPYVSLGTKDEVQPGKAYIYTTIEGNTPQKYEIEIVKAEKQSTPAPKGMVIRVTDKTLLEKTGGIVQGMSGSPIIQNGKLIGAVTHVFLSDSTGGYGMYIDWMMMQ